MKDYTLLYIALGFFFVLICMIGYWTYKDHNKPNDEREDKIKSKDWYN